MSAGDCGHSWDDGTLDVVAAVAAVREDRTGDLAVLMRHGCIAHMLVAAVKLLAEVLEEQEVAPERWRAWAQQAANRG